jgi:hypothetical protein
MTDESTATRSYVVLREEKAEGGLGYWLVGQTEAVSAIGAIVQPRRGQGREDDDGQDRLTMSGMNPSGTVLDGEDAQALLAALRVANDTADKLLAERDGLRERLFRLEKVWTRYLAEGDWKLLIDDLTANLDAKL